jgi:DNA repair protein RecN (Recombination protein N)
MLCELVVEGIGVIDRAELSLHPGCSALTGETGAGKTLLVAALSLLAGGRGDRALVREGAAEARAEGRFVVPSGHPAARVLQSHGIVGAGPEDADVELVITRSVPARDRAGQARINGRIVTVSLLEEIGGMLVDIAGQSSAAGLASPAVQRSLLDAYAGATDVAARLGAAVRAAARGARRERDLRSREREVIRELDVLAHEIAEIEKAAVRPGERDGLIAEAAGLEYAEEINAGVAAAVTDLHAEGGAEDRIAAAATALRRLATRDGALAGLAERLDKAGTEVADVTGELSGRVRESDPAALDAIRNRLGELHRLFRKYGGDEEAVLEYLERARARAGEIESLASELAAAERAAADGRARADRLAAELSELRHSAAPELAAAAERRLADLAMPGARVEIALVDRDLTEGGRESVEFLIAAAPGETPKPIARVASGGERSRIALALHLLAATGAPPTLVFDEVDSGVGGEAAQAVGRSLAELARTTADQVLVVTHLPQVAAFADRHYHIVKSGKQATAREISGDERVAELSRMLAGLPRSERAREHASELLELAHGLGAA